MSLKNLKKELLPVSIFFSIGFIISFILLNLYTKGDQLYYQQYYEFVKGKNIFDTLIAGRLGLNAGEPVSLLTLWLGSNLGFSKNIFISVLNGIFSSLIYLFLDKYNYKNLTILFILNYNVIVLFLSAERLKIAFIFIILALLSKGKKSYFYFIMSILSHFQILILIPSIIIKNTYSSIKILINKSSIYKKDLLFIIVNLTTLLIFFILFFDSLKYKFDYLDLSLNIQVLIDLMIFVTALFLSSKNRLESFLFISPFIFMVFIINSGRINQTLFFIVTYSLIKQKKLLTIPYIFLSFYYIFKTIPAITNIINYQTIFPSL